MQDCHLVVFMKLVCLDDPNSYAGGGVAPGRFNHAGVVKGEKPDKGQPLQVGGSLFQVLLFALRTSFRIASPLSERLEQARFGVRCGANHPAL